MRHNRKAFERWRIVPRMLHGVTQRDLSTSILGTQLSSPILLAPIGAASLVAGNSDLIIARGAAAVGTPYVISSQGCNPMEQTAAEMDRHRFRHSRLISFSVLHEDQLEAGDRGPSMR